MIRLNKYISDCGVCSRRKADDLISQGRVRLNDLVVEDFGLWISHSDKVYVDGKLINKAEDKYYIMLNKPKGYISAVSDDRGRKTVVELVKDINARLYPVGRLDYDTEGMLLLTNDGEFSYKMTHPKHRILKTYLVKVKKRPSYEQIKKLRAGIQLEEFLAKPHEVKIVKSNREFTSVLISIWDGKNREVRRMFQAVGYSNIGLKRIGIAGMELNGLPLGKYRMLTEEEVKYLEEKADDNL